MTASKIEWTDRSDWNPIRGCTRVSPGCGGPGPHGGCYAEAIAGRFSGPGQPFHGFAERTSKGARWTGKVELMEDRLTLPLRWRKPARIFASSTSDIFHESLPFEAIDKIFAVMALAPRHTFQVLTKRSARMREYMADHENPFHRIHRAAAGDVSGAKWSWIGEHAPRGSAITQYNLFLQAPWPLPNVWLGVSAEDQVRADERIPDLLATPAAVRFLSAEPLLGPIDLQSPIYRGDGGITMRGFLRDKSEPDDFHYWASKLDWIIAGSESGPKARPCEVSWVRSLKDQCVSAGTAFFWKQHVDGKTKISTPELDGQTWTEFPQISA